MTFEQKHIEQVKMDIRRYTRLFSRKELPNKIVEYLMDNFNLKIDNPNENSGETRTKDVPDKIISVVQEYFGFTIYQMSAKSRRKELVYARQVCMYLLATGSLMSLKTIGELFGGMDHTTVIHSRDVVLDRMKNQPHIKSEIKWLKNKINS